MSTPSRHRQACGAKCRWMTGDGGGGFALIDCHVYTEHFARFGAEEIPRAEYLDRLRAAGVTIVRADVPDEVKAAFEVTRGITASEFRASIEAFLLAQGTRVSFKQMAALAAPDHKVLLAAAPPPRSAYDVFIVQRRKIGEAIRAHFAKHGIVALAFPPAMLPAHKIGEDGSMTVRGQVVPNDVTMGRNVSLASCASMASLVLPAGLTSAGLPVGLEFDALSGTDRQLLSLGLSLQRALGPIAAPRV